MKRISALGLLLLCGLVAHAQTADIITGPDATLRPNALGGGMVHVKQFPIAAQQPGAPGAQPQVKLGPPPQGANQPKQPQQPPGRRPVRSVVVPNAPVKLDRYGDPLPYGALARYGSVRLRHGAEPLGLGFSPDGKMLGSIAATDDGIRLWDPVTGKELYRYPNPAMLAAFARDGSILVVDETRCKVWMPAANAIRDLPEKTFLENPVAIAVLPDCRSFLASTAKKVVQLDILTGKAMRDLNFPGEQPPVRLVVSADGRWCAGSAQKTGVWLWDLRTGKRVRTYNTEFDFTEFCFSPDGNRIAIATERLRIFPVDSEEVVEGFKPPEGVYQNPRFSRDGKTVFGINPEGNFFRIDAQTGEAKDPGNTPDTTVKAPMAIAPEGAFAAAVDASGGIRVWDPATGKEPDADRLPELGEPGFSADGKTVRCLDAENRIHSFEAATGKRLKLVELTVEEEANLSWNPRTGLAVVVNVTEQMSNEIEIVDVENKRVLHKLAIPTNGTAGLVSFSAIDKSRAAIFAQGVVCIVNLDTGKLIRTFTSFGKSEEMPPLRGAISPDGRLVAVNMRPLSVWEISTGKKRFDCDAVPFAVGAAFSPDGRYLAAWDPQCNMVVIDVRLGTVIRRIQTNAAEQAILAVAFSPDDKVLAVGDQDGGVTLWNLANGEMLAARNHHDSLVTGLAFSPDGTRLASTCRDGTVLIWEVATATSGKPIEVAISGLEEAFRLLGSSEASHAQRGLEFLYRRPVEAVKLIGERIAAPAATPPATIAKLIADLDSEDYPVRQAAVKRLQEIGGEAIAGLRTVAEKSNNPEARKLAGEVIASYVGTPPRAEDLRFVRAVELLENLNTTDARKLLTKWAAGPPGHRMTAEASAALSRLKSRE